MSRPLEGSGRQPQEVLPYTPIVAAQRGGDEADLLAFARLVWDGAPTEYRLIHPSGRTRHLWGRAAEQHERLTALNAEGYGVYAVVNAAAPHVEGRCAEGKGARDEDITAVRAVFVDFDGEGKNLSALKAAPLPPSLIVCSGLEHKLHGYWLLANLPLDEFTSVQRALAAFFGSDATVSNPARVMRLPGFVNTKPQYNAPAVRLLEAPGHLYTRTEVLEAFGIRLEPPKPVRRAVTVSGSSPADSRARRYALAALDGEVQKVSAAAEGTRNVTLNAAAFALGQLIGAGALERLEVEAALSEAARYAGLGEHETAATLRSGIEAGLLEPREIPEAEYRPRFEPSGSSVPASAEDDPWPARRPLPPANPPAPALPVELIPKTLRPWVVDVAERFSIPLEMPAAAAIVAAGGALGRGVGIHPQRHDDWLVFANLWGGIVAKPGMMKTPLIAETTGPLRRLEATAAEAFEQATAAHEVALERLELEAEACKKRMRKALDEGGNTAELEARLIELKREKAAVPAAPQRFVVQDSTVEKLGELLGANPRGVLLLRDELAGWLRSLERPGREGDREFYLETWSGDGSYTFDRIKRGTVRVPHLCLSVFGGIQPGKLKRYIQDAAGGGEGADGLLQRLQVVVWPESLGAWTNTDRAPDREAWSRARKVFDALAEYDAAALGLEPDEDGRAGLRFSAEAQELFYEWRAELERRVRSGELDHAPAFASHLSKYRSLMPALALLFHLIGLAAGEHDRGAISLDDARLAAAWCDYLEAHARRLYSGELAKGTLAAYALLERAEQGELRHESTVRDLYRAGWEGLSDRATVLEALKLLATHGHLRVVERATGGRPSPVLELHPELRR